WPLMSSAMRTNCPASKPRRAPSTRREKSVSVQCRFSINRPVSHFSLMNPSLHPIWLEVHVGHLAAQHDDGAMAAVVAGVGKLERIGAPYFQLPFLIACQAHLCECDGFVEELQLVALAGRA